jgi:pimeloyl-ACP methyl ester carboxylesterase
MKRILTPTLAISLLLTIGSCDLDPIIPERVLLGNSSILIRTAEELQTFLNIGGFDFDLEALEYDVDIHTVVYKTRYRGEDIEASALVILPRQAPAVGMISFQHGTIAAHSQAPTALHISSTELILYSALASPGFIAVVPDLIGFGSSKSQLHPYYIEEPTATAVIDAMRAARDLATDIGVQFNGKVFLAGYSEGGYATMATHKSLEEEPVSGFDLVASFPAAGGYDIKNMQEYFFGLTTYGDPFYIAFVAQAYKTTFDWEQPLSEFFQDPYDDRIPTLVNGSKTGDQINQELTTTIPSLIQADLISNIDTDVKYDYLVDAFIENSLTDWTPTRKIFMYHGDADVTVPLSNSQVTYDKLIANGTSSSVLTLTILPGSDHRGGVIPYVELFIPELLELK